MRWHSNCFDNVAQPLAYVMNYIDSTLLNAELLAGSSEMCLIYFCRDTIWKLLISQIKKLLISETFDFPPKLNQRGFYFFLLLQVHPFFYVVVDYDNINNEVVQPHENFRMQIRIQYGSYYNELHSKGVIIYQRTHNLPINNDSASHYLPGNFDWGVIILGESLLTVRETCWKTLIYP